MSDEHVQVRATIHLDERVSAGRAGEVGFLRRAHEVIPGTVVRGALASAWFTERGTDPADRTFREVFERRALIGQGVPESAVLIPLSARRCKYPEPECTPGWTDLAVDQHPHAGSLSACGDDEGRGWTQLQPLIRTTRSALAPDETAANGQLYAREAVAAGTVLTSTVRLVGLAPEVAEWFRRPRELRLGGQRSHQGLVRWEPDQAPPELPEVPSSGQRLVVRAVSPVVLVDSSGAPSRDLGRLVGGTTVRSWTRPINVEGWHTAAGVAKPADRALAAGSTWVLDDVPSDGVQRLARGVGLRRLEGYGQLSVLTVDQARASMTQLGAPPIGPVPRPARSSGTGSAPAQTTSAPGSQPGATLSPADASEAPPFEDVARPTERDPLDVLIDAILAGSPRNAAATLKSMGDALRMVKPAVDQGLSETAVELRRKNVGLLPWARDLGDGARAAFGSLLKQEDLAATVARVNTRHGAAEEGQ